jgi:hypothetical protein
MPSTHSVASSMDVSFLCVAAGAVPMGPMQNRVLIPDGTMFPVVLRAVRPLGRGSEAAYPPAEVSRLNGFTPRTTRDRGEGVSRKAMAVAGRPGSSRRRDSRSRPASARGA